ncbi:hypothetical protein NEUTE1DRAFT_61245 [Neurospora tetrasperma FGSC 2508]|uniref:MARVEL domain-containing protein n=1 Tax=Neurospora tetrasperma (strain FGSC 2508 / ATCC MYA-4615 / P0657) TaxID=510951 RepID=F8MHN2_NEUT8|nr:uncharacterized protein NEUTE1DRAFT_61245 [Neurospora tetrasperma FGSC 2508]EGO59643.1 hypothetical protein NEUTE1DRAFT_61245 [Neurospora tetrasperma FGSC 2508]EGZ73778.1 hypothetical protein NEUTE2DRAFT_149734 [Neurospora tetrasperma FGSC 2509]
MASARGLTAVGVPPFPSWILYIRIAILVLSLVLLGVAAWAVSMFAGGGSAAYGYTGASGMMIFVTIWSLVVYGGSLGFQFGAPHLFYRIVGLILYSLAVIFWLVGWAYAASEAAVALDWSGYYYGAIHDYGSAMAVCAGLGAVAWVLSIIDLVFFILACVREATTPKLSQAELGQVQPTASVAPATANELPPQPAYSQQPYAT